MTKIHFVSVLFETMSAEEPLISELFNTPRSEGQFFPIRLEGSQKYFPNQEADQDQVDLYANTDTNQGISSRLDSQL